MLIGDKVKKGFNMMESGKPEGAYLFYGAVCDLSLIDAIDERIFTSLSRYVEVMNPEESKNEANQWLKALMLDVRYGQVMLKPGDLLDNLCEELNKLPEIPDSPLVERYMEGGLWSLKSVDSVFFYIENTGTDGPSFLVREENGERKPIDFDVDDFTINRKDKRIEYFYTRGDQRKVSVDYNGLDKRMDNNESKSETK